jgi:HSP20 family protein
MTSVTHTGKSTKGDPMALQTRRGEPSNLTPARWDPWREFEQLQNRMGQLMENVWSDTGAEAGPGWVPLVDVEETEDAWVVEAELPGVKRNDINVELRDSELFVSGDIKERERKGILRRRTRRTGHFEFRVSLPGAADPEGIEASLKDGVLTVRVPKAEHARPRRIEVKGG